MLTDAELAAIRDENERRKEHTRQGKAYYLIAGTSEPITVIDRLLTEITELRLVLRDALQDSTPGNRVWREGVKAGLEAAADAFYPADALEPPLVPRSRRGAWISARRIRAIDPASILPAAGLREGGAVG